MRILYIHQYFKTPKEPGGTRSYWFARKLIENGFHVTMVTGRGVQKKLIEHVELDGIGVIYIRNPYSNDMGVLRRFISFVRFMFLSTYISLKQKNIQLVFATSTPLTVGFPALMLKWIKKIPFVFEVRDLWPEVPIQMGGINNSILKKIAIWFEKLIYKNAKHIIALSPGMKEGVISRGIDEGKVSMIPNMSKIDKFWKREKNAAIAKEFGIDLNKFNVIHFGTMGIANGLDYIINAAKFLRDDGIDDINFILLGKGGVKDSLVKATKENNLQSVIFIDAQPMSIVSEIVNLCDVSIVPFKNIPILQTNSPNKLFDSLSAGIPIIVNSAGWTKKLVEEFHCGVYVDPEMPDSLATELVKLQQNSTLLESMSVNARTLAENKYDKSILCQQYIDVIKELQNV